jgi:hypothetical protein
VTDAQLLLQKIGIELLIKSRQKVFCDTGLLFFLMLQRWTKAEGTKKEKTKVL